MKMLGYLTVVVCSSVILISTYEIMEKIGNSVLTFYGFVVGCFFLSAEQKMSVSLYFNPLLK